MGINLVFLAGKELFMIVVDYPKIIYNDKKHGLQEIYPNQSKLINKLFGKPTKKELEEYKMCKNNEELISIIIRESKLNNWKLISIKKNDTKK